MPEDFEIEFRWKEQVYYWEGSRGLFFDGGWGVQPRITYVPSPEQWLEVAPDWARDRREIIVQRLIDDGPHHQVKVDAYRGSIGVTR